MDCPVCALPLPPGAAGEAHVNAHFDGGGGEAGGGGGFGGALPRVTCHACGASVDACEADSHALAHALQAAEHSGAGGASDDFVDLTDDAPQPTQRGAQRPPAPPRIALSTLPGAQRLEAPPAEPGGLHALLRAALLAQPPGRGFRAVLAAPPLLHYATADGIDAGWGCGYRNMQMLCAHLLARRAEGGEGGGGGGGGRDERGEALFGGAGALPDVASLQAWLEAAWADGFDAEGAAQLGGSVQGSSKWVGATDCAALLRSFGLRARVVDFRPAGDAAAQLAAAAGVTARPPPPPQQQPGGGRAQRQAQPGKRRLDAAAVHFGVECDGCGQLPLRGPRFTSASRPNFDLCERCVAAPAAAPHAPYSRQEVPRGDAADGGATAAALTAWVWRYFTSDDLGNPLPIKLGEQVIASRKPPLFFQHDGHSRTIVGVERRRGAAPDAAEESLLLVLDPGTEPRQLAAALRRRDGWQRLVKRGVATLRKREYQLVAVEPGRARGDELALLRFMSSTLVQGGDTAAQLAQAVAPAPVALPAAAARAAAAAGDDDEVIEL